MSNKETFKKMYSSKINQERTFNNILKEIEDKNMKKNNVYKLALIPVCIILVICGIVIINKGESTLKPSTPIINKEGNYEIYINKIDSSKTNLTKPDADIKKIDAEYKKIQEMPAFNFLKNLNIPEDLSDKSFSAIYTRKDKDSKDYNILHNYDFWFESNDRRIILAFSDKNKPLRDYHFEEFGKISKINNQELTIYQYNTSYMTTFTYNGINFDIETNNLTESELTNLLTSIIK